MASDAFYWVPHPEEVWLPGKHQGGDSYQTGFGDVTVTEDKRGAEISDKTEMDGVDDCCSLVNVSAANILHTTRVRYSNGEIYTNVSNVLIAINPFKRLQIYGQEQIELYRNAQDRSTVPPHVFNVCAEAFQGLFEENKAQQNSQAVLISGESGAGKTESTKLVLLYTSEMLSGQEGGLEDLLMEINPILEAFGNAKTVRNNNSSRFGKWIEVSVDPAGRALKGVTVMDYLLESTRICGQGPNERNYHIFYQLAADSKLAGELGLENAGKSNYLKTNPMAIDGVDDKEEFSALRKALTTLNFGKTEEEEMFKTVGAILHIGNIEFTKGNEAKIENKDVLVKAAELLEVDKDALAKCIEMTRRVAGKDVVFSPNDPDKAKIARDSMSKLIYGMLFKWIVQRCNDSLGENLGADVGDGPFMGVLDIAGFESFEKNLLEQLLINLSNEKLQQFFNNKVFKTELAEYAEEAIDVTNIKFADNVEILNLIEGAGGVLSMLDDATNGVKQTDKMLVEKLIKEKASHSNFLKPKKFDPTMFGIKHYAGDVFYTAEGFLEKNTSTKPQEIVELLASSKQELLPELCKEDEGGAAAAGGPKKGGGKKPTVSGAYKKSLGQLMEKLKQANCHFIRCIKPNALKVPDVFTSAMVMDQLRLCGVMETVEIRKAGYLIRSKYADFVQRYMIVVDKDTRKQLKAAGDEKASAAGILKSVQAEEGKSALGKTKVFLKAHLYQHLEATRRAGFEPFALTIQSVWRGYRIREQMKEVKEVNVQLKTCIEQAGHALRAEAFQAKRIDRPTLAENTLKHFDILLMRAVNLPIKLGYIHEATKVRSHISAEAALARKLENLSLQLNVFEMEEALALANHHKMEGVLVEKVEKRLEAVKIETPLKEALHAAVDIDELDDLTKAVDDATAKGLDVLTQWTMPSGAAIMEKAVVRKIELEEEKAKREAFLAAIRAEVEEHMSSSNIEAVRETLARAAAAEIQGESVDKLAARCAILEIHLEIQSKLQECLLKSSIADIEAVIKLAEDQGIRDGKWTSPDGKAALASAEQRIAELKAEKEAEEKALRAEQEKLLADIKEGVNSVDYETIQELVTRGREKFPVVTHPEEAKEMVPLEERLAKMDEETALIKKMQGLLNAETREEMEPIRLELVERGLAGNEEAWLLKDGHMAWQAMEERLVVIEDKDKVIDVLKQAAENMDVDGIEKAIAKCVALGIPEDKYKTYNTLNNKLQNTNHVRDFIQKHKDNPTAAANLKTHLEELTAREGGAVGMLELKLKRLVNSSNTEMMRTALREAERNDFKGEVVDQIRNLCQTLERQQPQLQKLQEVLFNGDLEALQKAVAEFKEGEGEEGMAHPDEWPCEGLRNFYERVAQKTEELEAERPQSSDIEAKLHTLKTSSDVIAIREGLKEAERVKFTGPVLEEVSERFKTIEKQKSYLMQIRHCVLSRDPDIVRGVLEEGMKRSLDNPSNWLLEDGPRSYALLSGYLKELEAKKKGDDAASAEVGAKLREVKSSTDVNEIRAALAKAAANKVKSELVATLEDRVKRLEKQGPLLKSLKGVLRATEAEVIQKLILEVRAQDLVNPRNWVYPDGAKVFSKVVTRKLWCEKVEDLVSRSKKAMEVFNVSELEDCFKTSEFMGVPETKLAEAKTLYLELQKFDHVEKLLAGLEDKKKVMGDATDPKIDEATTCLVAHLAHLGHKTDHSKLKDVAERAAHTKTSTGGKPYYATAGNLTESVFQDLANYKNLRDPLTWPTEYPVSHDPDLRTRAMVSFQAEKIVQSLTVLKPYSERIAAQNFLDLLRCMGDKPCAYTGDKQDPILKRLTVSRAVCDEIYMQVMKQLSSNPSVDSTTKGWELLMNMVKVALPSAEVYEFLMAFVTREAMPAGEEQKKEDAAAKKGGWRAAFFAVAKKQREEQVETLCGSGPSFNLAAVASAAMAEAKADKGMKPRQSMVERQLAREKRKSRVAAAEERQGDSVERRKAFAAKQVDMAAEVLSWLGGKKK